MNINYRGSFFKTEFNKEISNLSNSIIFSKNSEILEIYKTQIMLLENKCHDLLKQSQLNFELNNINTTFRKSIDNPYYLYESKTKGKYLSLINQTEWNNNDKYIGCYKLNGDLSWSEYMI